MNLLNQFRQISCFAFDVDGVLTDGSLLLLDDGQQVRRMHIKDGYALQLAVKMGYRVLVISGGSSPAVPARLARLGIHDVFMGVEDKTEVLDKYRQQHRIPAQELLFMGDDIPDYSVMKTCGLPCCPADAVPEIKEIAMYISAVKGGEGCVRDVIEKVMKLNGHWKTDSAVAAK